MTKHSTKTKKLTAALMLFALLAGLLCPASMAAGAGNILHTSAINISDSLSFVNAVYEDSGSRQESFAFDFSPGGDTGIVVWYGSKLSETATITKAAAQLEAAGHYVLGGMNADFFSLSTGLALGTIISGGKLISTSDESCAVCFAADGSASVTTPSFDIVVTNHGGGDGVDNSATTVQVGYFNKLRTAYAIYLLDSDFADTNRAELKGRDVLMRIDSGSVTAGGSLEATVTALYEGSTPTAIPEGHLLLTASSICPYYDELTNFAVGDRLSVSFGCSDPVLSSAVTAIGCGDILIENGSITDPAAWDSAISASNPRTLLGIRADGTVRLAAYDGRQARAAGLTLQKAAEELLREGCVTAVNLDGGGSTAALLRDPVTDELRVVNSPSSGSLRACASYIFFVSTAVPSGTAQRLYLSPADPVVLAGATVSFDGIAARDSAWRSVPMPAGLSAAVSGGIGSFDTATLSFTAEKTAANGSITLSCGSAYGSTGVTVTDKVSSLSLSLNDSGKPLNSLILEPGQTAAITVTANAFGVTALADASVFEYSLSPALGSIDENGVITAGTARGVSGRLSVSYGGTTVDIPVKIPATQAALIENFEADSNIFTGGSGMGVTTVRDEVYRGHRSGYIDYDLTTGTALHLLPAALELEHAPERIMLAARGDGVCLSLVLQDSGGMAHTVDLGQVSGEYSLLGAQTGLDGSCSLLGFMLTGTGSGRLLIDQLFAPATDAEDTTAPGIRLSMSGSRLTAYLSDNSGMAFTEKALRLCVDGTPAAFTVADNVLTAELSLDGAAHSISLTASDAAGNLSRASLNTPGSYTASPFSDVDTEHWAFDRICALSDAGVIQGDGAGKYLPDRAVTREQFCTMLSRSLGLDTTVYNSVVLPFTDAADISSWALSHVRAVYALGYVGGKAASDGSVYFAPAANITRAEIFTLIGRLTEKGYGSTLDFTDSAEIPVWAREGVSTVVGMGLVNGYTDGSIRTGRTASRAEVAKLLFDL